MVKYLTDGKKDVRMRVVKQQSEPGRAACTMAQTAPETLRSLVHNTLCVRRRRRVFERCFFCR